MAPAPTRRQKIQEELAARQLNSKELWRLQQEMLKASSTPSVMEAARQLLQVEHYEAVVEERSVEGLCGYPPCCQPALEVPERKRWSVNYTTREVIDTAELRKFCSSRCRKESLRFRSSLQPEPIYLRPDAAVRAAEAAASPEAPRETAEVKEVKEEKELPKVRPKTVVRFSRERQSYSVHYSDYDGGGALPDVPSMKADGCQTDAVGSDSDGDGDFYDPDVVPDGKCSTPWIHVWNTLNTWMTESAKEVLRGASPEIAEDRRPAHKGRRDLLIELLSSRLPGEFSFLASRFYHLVSNLGVHQTLPSVTEHRLYDLLAAILINQLYHMEIKRGLFDLDNFQAELLDVRMKEAASAFNISEEDLQMLLQLVRSLTEKVERIPTETKSIGC